MWSQVASFYYISSEAAFKTCLLWICTSPLSRPWNGLVIGSACNTAYPQACTLSKPTPLPWSRRELASNPALVLCAPPPRSPRQRRTSWPTVKLTCERTLSSSQCLRRKTPSERRSSFAPSSDSVCYENVSFSVCKIPGRDCACS